MFSFDIQFGPQISYRTRTLGFTIGNDDWSSTDDPILTLSGGVILYLRLSKRFEFGLGLLYSGKGYKNITHYPDSISSLPLIPEKTKSLLRYQHVDLPLLVIYNIKESEKLNLSIQSGFAVNYLVRIQQISYFYYPDEPTETNTFILDSDQVSKRFNLSAKLGFGINYKVSNRISFGFNPMFDYYIFNHFNKVNEYNGSMRFWDIGGMIVIKHRF